VRFRIWVRPIIRTFQGTRRAGTSFHSGPAVRSLSIVPDTSSARSHRNLRTNLRQPKTLPLRDSSSTKAPPDRFSTIVQIFFFLSAPSLSPLQTISQEARYFPESERKCSLSPRRSSCTDIASPPQYFASPFVVPTAGSRA